MSDSRFCHKPHPFGARYRLQGSTSAIDGGTVSQTPTRLFCPWCDWQELRGTARQEAQPPAVNARLPAPSGLGVLDDPSEIPAASSVEELADE